MESNDSLQKEISVEEKQVPQQSEPSLDDEGLNVDTDTVSQTPASDTVEEKSDETNDSTVTSGDSQSRHQYTKEELIAISKLSLARIRPKCLDNMFNNDKNGLWNPEKWISSRSPNGHTSSTSWPAANKYKKEEKREKANSDLKERILEENNDDIVLSPQRGSFGTGCHVSSASFGAAKAANETRNRDHYNDRNKLDENSEANYRSNNVRRIGTGRVGNKEREMMRERTSDWGERSYEKSFERNGRDMRDNRDRNDDFNDRRNRNRFNDRRPNNRYNRYDSDRRDDRNRYEEEEPEWFTEGPTSKLETIELRGFDDEEPVKNDKEVMASKGHRKDGQSSDGKQVVNDGPKGGKGDGIDKNEDKTDEFDVNAWMKTENWFGDGAQTPEHKMISSFDGISNDKECDTTSSRFKRWFPQDNANQANKPMATDSRQSDIPMNRNEPRVLASSGSVPSNTQRSSGVSPEKIFELLKGPNRFAMEQIPLKIDTTKMVNLAEIEANLPNASTPVSSSNKVFDKLFTEIGRKSVQSPSSAAPPKVFSLADFKGETNVFQTQNSQLIVPKASIVNAPSILDMLRDGENKEAIERNNRVLVNQAMMRANANAMSGQGHNSVPVSQNSVQAMPAHGSTNGANLMAHNWQNNSPQMKVIRPTRQPNVSSNEMSEQNNLSMFLLKRQQMEMQNRPQSLNDSIRANTPGSPGRTGALPNANFFTPTSVMRNMHSEKDKSIAAFNETNSESNSSQLKFLNMNEVHAKPSPMRPIVKSNNPIGQSMTAKKHVMQSPMTSHSDQMSFAVNHESAHNPLVGRESQLVHQMINQNSSPYQQRSANSSNTNVRPFGLEQSQVLHNSTHSPNAMPNQMSKQSIFQMLGHSNIRPNANALSINQMMALQHNSNEGRQSQYFTQQSPRPITAQSVQSQMMPRDAYSFDAGMMQESATTYRQQRSHVSPSLGQIFGQEKMHQSLSEMSAVPLPKNAFTLEDIERV